MKKATVYFTEKNRRLEWNKSRSLTIEIPDEMFNGWNWEGVVERFRYEVSRRCCDDSTLVVKGIKLGRAVLQGNEIVFPLGR